VVKEEKIRLVEELAKKMEKAKTVAIADIGRIPSRQFQEIRKALRGEAEIKVVKKRLLIRALKKAKLDKLKETMAEKPAVILANVDPFELFKKVKSLRTPMAAKPGMVAERDIVVPEGGTGLPPGPAIGELQAAGIPAKIEKGQIVVIKETVVAKAGEIVTPKVANALNKLGITPFEVGLEITGALEGNILFPREVLDIDYGKVRRDIETAGKEAFALAYSINFPVKEVIEMRLKEAALHAKSLALAAEWVTGETLRELLAKAHAHATALNARVGGD